MGNVYPVIQTRTKDGEVTINLNLTIRLDAAGKITLDAQESPRVSRIDPPTLEDNTGELIDFGRSP